MRETSKSVAIVMVFAVWLVFLTSLARAEVPYSIDWPRQFGASTFDYGNGVACDAAGYIYLAGSFGHDAAYLRKYNSAGDLLWNRELSTTEWDYGWSVALDSAGRPVIIGSTEGNIGGPNAGSSDVFLSKYDSDGALLWSQQWGAEGNDSSVCVAVSNGGEVYVGGYFDANPFGLKENDAFLVKLTPEPASLLLLGVGGLSLLRRRHRLA